MDQSELDISTSATSTQSRKVMFWGWALQMRFFQVWRRVKRRSSLMEFKNTTMSFFGKSINLFAKSMLLTWKSLQLEFTQTITATLYSRHLKLIHIKVRAVPFHLKSGNRQPTISQLENFWKSLYQTSLSLNLMMKMIFVVSLLLEISRP